MAGVNLLPSNIQEAYQNDPQTQLALMLMKEGTSTEPIRTPLQGWGRLAQALAGTYSNYKQRQRYGKAADEQNASLMEALKAQQQPGAQSSGIDPRLMQLAQTGNPMATALVQQQMKLQSIGPETQARAIAEAPYKLTWADNGAEKWQVDGLGREVPNSRMPMQMTPQAKAQREASDRTFAEDARHHREDEAIKRVELQSGKVPAGYRAKPDGSLEFIPGGPADPAAAKRNKPTEDQAKNAQLYQRAAQQAQILLGNDKTPGVFDAMASTGNQLGGKIGFAPLTSADYQSADAALIDLASSYLYSVSGATANPGEVANLTKTLRPAIGESAQSVAQKKTRVQQMVDSIKTRAAGAATAEDGQQSAQQALPSKNTKGWALHHDASGNKAYVGPKGEIEEVP